MTADQIEYANWQQEIENRDSQILIKSINSLAMIDIIQKQESNSETEKLKKIRSVVLLFQAESNIDF